VRAAGTPHLTYCTNIHAGETWPEVRNAVERHVTRVKDAMAGDSPFGVGLRLSARAAAELSEPDAAVVIAEMLTLLRRGAGRAVGALRDEPSSLKRLPSAAARW
jgi:hypothetical protein